MKNIISEKDLRNPEYRGFWQDLSHNEKPAAKSKTNKPEKTILTKSKEVN